MSDSKEIVKQKFIEHFLFDYTDKDEFEIQMLSEIFEGIYYQKDKHFKPESKYWQVFRCLQDQQTIINNLKSRLNNMEACYIGVKKEVEGQQKRIEEVCQSIDLFFDDQVGTPTQREYCNFIAEIKQALRGEHE